MVQVVSMIIIIEEEGVREERMVSIYIYGRQ